MNGRDKRRRSQERHRGPLTPPLSSASGQPVEKLQLVYSNKASYPSPAPTPDLAQEPAPLWPDGEPHERAGDDYAPGPVSPHKQ